jgi:hypothetical protein
VPSFDRKVRVSAESNRYIITRPDFVVFTQPRWKEVIVSEVEFTKYTLSPEVETFNGEPSGEIQSRLTASDTLGSSGNIIARINGRIRCMES